MDRFAAAVHRSACQFCLNARANKTYLAAPLSFLLIRNSVALISSTEWQACETCAALIDQGRWNDLTDRVAQILIQREQATGNQPDFPEQIALKQKVQNLHAAIREAMGRTA